MSEAVLIISRGSMNQPSKQAEPAMRGFTSIDRSVIGTNHMDDVASIHCERKGELDESLVVGLMTLEVRSQLSSADDRSIEYTTMNGSQ